MCAACVKREAVCFPVDSFGVASCWAFVEFMVLWDAAARWLRFGEYDVFIPSRGITVASYCLSCTVTQAKAKMAAEAERDRELYAQRAALAEEGQELARADRKQLQVSRDSFAWSSAVGGDIPAWYTVVLLAAC